MAWIEGNQNLYRKFREVNEEILSKEGYIEEGEAKLLLYKFLRENPSFTSESDIMKDLKNLQDVNSL